MYLKVFPTTSVLGGRVAYLNLCGRTALVGNGYAPMRRMSTGKVIVYGGKGALGSTLIDVFKKHKFWVLNIDLAKNEAADENVVVDGNSGWLEQEQAILLAVGSHVSMELDGIFCVAGGWAGGNAAKDEFIRNADMMWKQSVWSSAIAARLASIHLKEGGILQLTGAAAAENGTPGMIGYGMAKAAVHHLVASLSCPESGMPKDSSVVAILPVTLDTPMNRKWMPEADHSTWTPMTWIAEQFLSWLKGEKPETGSLLKLTTQGGETAVHKL